MCQCENKEHHLSISHSNGYAAAAIAKKDIGIDIQTFVSKIYRIKEKFTTIDELEVFHSCGFDEITSLHIIWTIKESVFKLYGRKELPFKEGIIISECRKEDERCLVKGSIKKDDLTQNFKAESILTDKYCFTKALYE